MSDDEFQKGEAGSSHTYPESAGSVKKGAYCMLKGFPCRVVDMSTSKAGKHGHAKASIVGVDIFTGKKYEDSCPTSHNIDIPFVKKKDYQLVDVQDDGFLSVMDDSGEMKEDLKLPEGTDDDLKIATGLREMFAEGKYSFIQNKNIFRDIFVQVMSAMGQEKVVGFRENQN